MIAKIMSKIAETVYSFSCACKLCFLNNFGLNTTSIVFNRNSANSIFINMVRFSFDLISKESIGTIYGAIFYIKEKLVDFQLVFYIFDIEFV